MTTSNKNFKVKNGLEVLGTSATINGNQVLTVASSIAALADVDVSGAVAGNALVFDEFLNLIPGQGSSGGSAKYIVSDTKPLDPTDGLVWYNSLTGESFIYIVDVDSGQWVELGGMGPQGPTGPAGADSTVPGPQGDQGESGIVAQATPPADTTVMWYDTSVEGYGIPLGGVTGQVLTKIDGADHNTAWQTPYGQTDADADIASLVDGAPTALNTLNKIAAAINDDATFATTINDALDLKANASHTHAISDITSLQTALDGKANTVHDHDASYYTKAQSNDLLATKADEVHTHDDRYYTESEMNTLLADKASEAHTHTVSDVSGLQNSLNTLQTNIDSKSNISHIHQISHITGLQAALDTKASYSHIHDDRYYTETEVDDKLALKATLNSSPTFTGTVAAPIINASTSMATVAMAISGAATIGTTLGVTGTTTMSTLNAGTITATGNVNPQATNSYDLGTSSLRWRNIYTQDLHLSNGIGDYTVIEGTEELYLVNNNNGKHFKFALIEVDPSEVPAKSESD